MPQPCSSQPVKKPPAASPEIKPEDLAAAISVDSSFESSFEAISIGPVRALGAPSPENVASKPATLFRASSYSQQSKIPPLDTACLIDYPEWGVVTSHLLDDLQALSSQQQDTLKDILIHLVDSLRPASDNVPQLRISYDSDEENTCKPEPDPIYIATQQLCRILIRREVAHNDSAQFCSAAIMFLRKPELVQVPLDAKIKVVSQLAPVISADELLGFVSTTATIVKDLQTHSAFRNYDAETLCALLAARFCQYPREDLLLFGAEVAHFFQNVCFSAMNSSQRLGVVEHFVPRPLEALKKFSQIVEEFKGRPHDAQFLSSSMRPYEFLDVLARLPDAEVAEFATFATDICQHHWHWSSEPGYLLQKLADLEQDERRATWQTQFALHVTQDATGGPLNGFPPQMRAWQDKMQKAFALAHQMRSARAASPA